MSPGQTPESAAAALQLPWATASFSAAKGVLHEERSYPAMKPETRDALLTAIAKARVWIDDLVQGRAASLGDIAERESKGERHIRLLASLAFVSPALLAAIVEGAPSGNTTVTGLAQRLSYSWAKQAQAGIPAVATRTS